MSSALRACRLCSGIAIAVLLPGAGTHCLAQSREYGCYAPPRNNPLRIGKPVFSAALGVQKPFKLRNFADQNEFSYTSKWSAGAQIRCDAMVSDRIGLQAGLHMLQEKYGLRFTEPEAFRERAYYGVNVYKFRLSAAFRLSERIFVSVGPSLNYKYFYLTQSTGSSSFSSGIGAITGYRYSWTEPDFSEKLSAGADLGLELMLTQRFAIELRTALYFDRTFPMTGEVEVYQGNGATRTYSGALDAQLFSAGAGLVYRLSRPSDSW